ncbi:hypothetical protein IP70_15770 [alpha proteobacterium AAP38]|nr:hypothetical protein IP70_15770 [alpha proteobacterium AAP38]
MNAINAQLLTSHYFRVDTNGMTFLGITTLGKPEMLIAIPPVTIRKMGRELREIADLPAVKRIIETPKSPTRYQTDMHNPAPMAVSVSGNLVLVLANLLGGLEAEMLLSPELARQMADALLNAADQADKES